MTSAFTWNRTNFTPASITINLVMSNTSGGIGFGGSEQIVANTPPFWVVKYGNLALNTTAQIRQWNQYAGLTQGRLNAFLIPIFDRNRAPGTPTIATMVGDMDVGDTVGQIKTDDTGGTIAAGMHFSYNQRLYRLARRQTNNDTAGFTTHDVTIVPPLREAIDDGELLEFDDPFFRVKLLTDDEMSNVELVGLKFGTTNISFREDV